MATMESLKAKILLYTKEAMDDDQVTDVINDGIASLWQSMILANSGTYLSQNPVELDDDSDEIPFSEVAAIDFLKYWGISLLLETVFEFDAAEKWKNRAEEKRLQAIQQIMQSSRREETVEQFDPYALN